MALVLGDRIRETTTIVGTGTATLLGAVVGFQAFSVIGTGNTTYYCIADQGGANWEVGIGTYTSSGNTLARTTVLSSSNAGSLVSFAAGTHDVFVCQPSEKAVYTDGTGQVTLTGNTVISTTDNTNAALRVTQLGTGNALLVEDSTNPDATPFVIDSVGGVIVGHTSNIPSVASLIPYVSSVITGASQIGYSTTRFQDDVTDSKFVFNKARGTVSAPTIVASADGLGKLWFAGYDGAAYIRGALIEAVVDGTPGLNNMPGRLVFSTTANGSSTPTERMRIDSAGSVGIGGGPSTGVSFDIQKAQTGAVTAFSVSARINPDTTVTSAGYGFSSFAINAVGASTANIYHYNASQGTFSGTAPTNQYGVSISANLIGATNNYSFYGNIPSGTGRYNLYMSGSADNYLAGSLGIGSVPGAGQAMYITKTITGTTFSNNVLLQQTISSDVTNTVRMVATAPFTQAATFTLGTLIHYNAAQGTFGVGSAVTNQRGFSADSSLTGATNNYGFYGAIAAGTGRYNLYMNGTAANYLAGDLQLGKVITATGTNGAQTINTTTGSVNFAIAATSLVVTNSLVTANSIIIATVASNDTTMKSVQVVAAAGSFTLYASAAATAETRVNFQVTN